MNLRHAIILEILWLLAPLALAQLRTTNRTQHELRDYRHDVPWNFADDFSHGIRGWMSFPLAQDIGYDPSLYTTVHQGHACLVRDVIAEGQSKLRIGFVRSIRFRFLPRSSIQFRYQVEVTGHSGPAQLLLAAISGRKYTIAIPTTIGEHTITVRGSQLDVPASGVEIEAIALQATALNPLRGTHNRLLLDAMDIDARHRPTIAFLSPTVEYPGGDGMAVANTIVRVDMPLLPLKIDSPTDVTVTLMDASGHEAYRGAANHAWNHVRPSPLPGLWQAHLSTRDATSDFRFLVLGSIPAHPRLLLTSKRLEELRARMPPEALRKLIQKQAALEAHETPPNAHAGDNILRMSNDSLFPGLTQYFDLLDHYGDVIVLNALDFQLRGSHESLDKARLALLAAAHWPTWTPPWFQVHGLQSYYEAGIFSQRVALGYDLIADHLSESDKREIADALYRNAVLPAVTDYFTNERMPIADSNHAAHTVGGAIAACMAVYGDVPDWDTRFGPALAKLIAVYEHLLQNMFLPDGSEAEPVGYQEFAMRGLSIGAAALAHAGIQPQGTDRLLNSFWWPYYVQYKPGYELDTGDEIGTLFAHSGFAWAAETSSDSALRAFYESATTRTLAVVFQNGQQSAVLPDVLDLTCCTNTVKPVAALPLSRLFPARGSAALRSGWDDSSTLISVRVGPWFNHGHYDEGSFQIASHGEILVGEAGYTSYYNDPRFADYFTQAVGHNVELIDHNVFSQDAMDSSHWKAFAHYPRFTHHLLGDGVDFLEADLQPAYPDSSLDRYTRQYVFLKPGFFFVHDNLSSRMAHSYTFLLHPADDIQPVLHGTNALLQGTHSQALVVAGSSELWQTSPAPLPVTAYTNFDRNVISPRSIFFLEAPRARAAHFTIGIQLRTSGLAEGPLRSISTNNADGFLDDIDGIAILFRRGIGELSLQSYATDGNLLAIRSNGTQQSVFVEDAHRLSHRNQADISADRSITAERTHTPGHDRWQMACAQAVSVEIAVPSTISSATMDGSSMSSFVRSHFLRLRLQPGEHRVDLHY